MKRMTMTLPKTFFTGGNPTLGTHIEVDTGEIQPLDGVISAAEELNEDSFRVTLEVQ